MTIRVFQKSQKTQFKEVAVARVHLVRELDGIDQTVVRLSFSMQSADPASSVTLRLGRGSFANLASAMMTASPDDAVKAFASAIAR